MTGVEQLVVWLVGIVFASTAAGSAVKAWAAGRVQVAEQHARAHVEGLRVMAEAQQQTVIVPPQWSEEGS